MTRALILTEHDLATWRAAHQRGLRPSALPYGVDRVEAHDFSLVAKAPCKGEVARKAWSVLEGRLGLKLEVPVRAIPYAARADLTIALLETNASLPALLKRRAAPPYSRSPLVVLSCWLGEDIRRASTAKERERLRRRLEAVDLLVYLSQNQTKLFLDMGLSRERLFPVPFGVDGDFYHPVKTRQDIDVLAVGQDRGRDYATLLAAAAQGGFSVDLVCRPSNLAGLTIPPNVRVHGPIDHITYRSMLHRAKVVAVPSLDLAYPTGQTVALEASCCGKCVVVTGTTPMLEYFQDDENGLVVPVGSASSLRKALLAALENPALRGRLGETARERALQNYTTQVMWDSIINGVKERGLIK